jgi:hypothetical protein
MRAAISKKALSASTAAQNKTFSVQRSAFLLTILVLLSIAARLTFWHWYVSGNSVPPGDPEEYYRAALHMLHGGYHDTGKWLRPPGYPALLALLLPLAGMNVAGALLLQCLVLGVGVLAFYALGRQLFGQAEGLVAALMAALFVPLAAFSAALYAEALFVTLLALALAALDRAHVSRRPRWALAAGVLLGVATLTRAVGLFFIPLAALWLIFSPRRHEDTKQNRKAFVSSCLRGSVLLAGALVVIAPWSARNYVVHQRLILVDTNGGISMWWGTVQSPEEKAARDEELFAVPNLADRQALALRWTAERIAADPLAFVARARYKLASLFLLQTRSYAAGDLISISPAGEPVVQNAGELALGPTLLADAQYILIMLLGIAGICFTPSLRRALPTIVWIMVACGLAALTIGHPRLRLPIVTVLMPFAAFGLVQLANAARGRFFATERTEETAQGEDGERRRQRDVQGNTAPALSALTPSVSQRSRKPARLLAALAASLVFLALIGSTRYVTWVRGEWHAFAARGALAAGNASAARQSLERARATDPANALRSVALADLELRQGDLPAADALFSGALELERRNLYSRAVRVLLANALERPAQAIEEFAAFDGYWRARDDLFQWAWRHPIAPPAARLVPGAPAALGHFAGFAPATEDLPQGRWTLGDGRMRVAGSCGELVLNLRGPAGRAISVTVEDWIAPAPVALTGQAQELRIPLGTIRGCEYEPPLVVRVRSATSLLDLERAPWYVGVAVLEARVEP